MFYWGKQYIGVKYSISNTYSIVFNTAKIKYFSVSYVIVVMQIMKY